MSLLIQSPTTWRLSTKVVSALAISMLPLGIMAIVLAVRNEAAIASAPIVFVEMLAVVLPILMWLAALFTGWYAIYWLIVAPLAKIQGLIACYGASTDPVQTRQGLADARFCTAEIAALAASFDSMAASIEAHSKKLREALAEQQRLKREVHHRVRNNLQIVASLLSLQARSAENPEVSQAYSFIQARILTLTLVHRWMYDDAASNGVDLRLLLADLSAQLENKLVSANHPRVTVECNLADAVIHPDLAAPVAFLVTELASLAAEIGAPGPLAIRVAVTIIEHTAKLTVSSSAFAGADPLLATSSLPTARIVEGMARQLRATLIHDPVAGAYCVRFAASEP